MARGSSGWDVGSIFDGSVQESLNTEGVMQAIGQIRNTY